MKRILSILTFVLIVIGSASADGLYDGLYDRPTYFPDFTPPPSLNNMSYLVYVKTPDGGILENYEIAVYDQYDKLRAVGRSRHADDEQCMLTIGGDEMDNDVFHFEVIYGDFEAPTIKQIIETIPFETNGVYGLYEDVFLTIYSDPTVAYWTSDPFAEQPTAEVVASEVSSELLESATRIELRGSWKDESVADLFDGCKSLLYVEMNTLPGTTDGAFTDANPNCLKILPDGLLEAPDGWTNCISGGKALTDFSLEDGTQSAPYSFYTPVAIDLNGHKATYHRTEGWLYADGTSGWNTVVVPFDAEVQADGFAVTPLTQLDLGNAKYNSLWKAEEGYWACPFLFGTDENEMVFDDPISSGTIAANTPYIFALPGKRFKKTINSVTYSLSMEGKDITFVSTGTTIPATPKDVIGKAEEDHSDYSIAHFVGTYQVRLSQPMSLLRNGACSDGRDAFVYYTKGNIMPFRGYIQSISGAPSSSPQRINIAWSMDGIIDSIGRVSIDRKPSVAYDLMGRRLTGDEIHGLVIINNRLVLK